MGTREFIYDLDGYVHFIRDSTYLISRTPQDNNSIGILIPGTSQPFQFFDTIYTCPYFRTNSIKLPYTSLTIFQTKDNVYTQASSKRFCIF